jgi:hypothetical protein
MVNATTGVISTVAGGGFQSDVSGIPATSKQISPAFIAVDSIGNAVFSSQNSNLVYKVYL